jgi:catechol 2,3-dioxygenase-like lactoylglutathione lyase family enzyme
MTVVALERIGRNVVNLEAALAFYTNALGFRPAGVVREDANLAALLGVRCVRAVRLKIGGREIELSECEPAGAAYPAGAANDLCFQHFAIVTPDIAASRGLAMAHGAKPISSCGPQKLPDSSGGVTAWKFRDPDGHPLEFLQFPKASDNAARVDHTAISISDVDQSIAFYQSLGLRVAQRTLNCGVAQEALDGLVEAVVDVVAMQRELAMMHVELLHYRAPVRGISAAVRPGDIAADRMVFKTLGGRTGLQRDPDGHFLVLTAAE